MSDLIKLTSGTKPFEEFWISASTIVLVEPVAYSYGIAANTKITLESGDIRRCCETPAEVAKLVAEAHTDVKADTDG